MPATKIVEKSGSVRIDLVGGTLDIPPLHLIIKDAITLNLATSLKAKVICSEISENKVIIHSKDYESVYEFTPTDFSQAKLYHSDFFGPMQFVAQILDFFEINSNIKIDLESGSPAGAGLGGSSSMGVTLFNALAKYIKKDYSAIEAIQIVRDIEARILNAGMTGYQDYYPALFGGVLALKPKTGEIEIEQLYSPELAAFLEAHTSLIYTGLSRNSGINNWEVYKNFFDRDQVTVDGLSKIAKISNNAFLAIKNLDFTGLLQCINDEGQARRDLFPNIETIEMREFFREAIEMGLISGMKVCGAGGGGCFMLTHSEKVSDRLTSLLAKYSFKKLNFCINPPL